MLTTITDLLTALIQLLKQKHQLSEDYQKHLLYERLQDGIDEDIDRIKEIALACGYSEEISNADSSLLNASAILETDDDVYNLELKTIQEINKIITKIDNNKEEQMEGVFNEIVAKEGIKNMLGDIAEKRVRDIYLLRFGSK